MHLGIIKITYNRTATHFMDDRFVNLGEEVIPTMLSELDDKMTVMIGIMSDYVVVLSSCHLNCRLVVVLSSKLSSCCRLVI